MWLKNTNNNNYRSLRLTFKEIVSHLENILINHILNIYYKTFYLIGLNLLMKKLKLLILFIYN